MTTGAMPPGCTKGGGFIHDPKVRQPLSLIIIVNLIIARSRRCLGYMPINGCRICLSMTVENAHQ